MGPEFLKEGKRAPSSDVDEGAAQREGTGEGEREREHPHKCNVPCHKHGRGSWRMSLMQSLIIPGALTIALSLDPPPTAFDIHPVRRPMSQYLEALEIVDGRVLWVLTDEMLQELGLAKRLHRLVLINKIAKEKAKCQLHDAMHFALARIIKHLVRGEDGDGDAGLSAEQRNDAFDQHSEALQRRVLELMNMISLEELKRELSAKLERGGWLCDIMLYLYAESYTPFVDQEIAGMMPRAIRGGGPEEGGDEGGGWRSGEASCESAMRTALMMVGSNENMAFAAEKGLVREVVARLEECVESEAVLELGLAILVRVCSCGAKLQASVAKEEGVGRIAGAVARHPESEAVCEQGVGLLWLLAHDSSVLDQIVESGGIAAVVAAMTHHKGSDSVMEHGCGILRMLCASPAHKARAKAEGAIAAVVKGMVVHSDHKGVQAEGAVALRLMSATEAALGKVNDESDTY